MIIGIGGVSRAGKSTLAEKMKVYFQKDKKTVQVFCQDDYVKPSISIPMVQGVPDWERPSTIKWDTLTKEVENSPANVKIVEGLFAFYPASLRAMYDIKVFVTLDKELFLRRKTKDARWGEEPDWYAEHVWRSFLKYGQIKGDKSEYLEVSGSQTFDAKHIITSFV